MQDGRGTNRSIRGSADVPRLCPPAPHLRDFIVERRRDLAQPSQKLPLASSPAAARGNSFDHSRPFPTFPFFVDNVTTFVFPLPPSSLIPRGSLKLGSSPRPIPNPQPSPAMPHAPLTRAAVAAHNKPDDLWCIIDHKVYDLSDFSDAHPGGSVVLEQVAGTDATSAFYNLHRQEVLAKYAGLCVGTLEGEQPEVVVARAGDLSGVPYAEPLWLREPFKSPYFGESHHALRRKVREFVDTHVTPEAQDKERSGEYISQELIDRMAANDLLAMRLGPGKHLHGKNLMGVVRGEEFDYLHDLVQAQEFVRANARGFQDGNMAGMMISLTAVLQWMPESAFKQKVVDEVLSGKKKMCLAVTEAFAGSDVAGLRTTATKTPDRRHYIIRGTKKWVSRAISMFPCWSEG